MPRYCAVKLCRNRGGTLSKQHNKRISFYPFPLQDKPRLQKWVNNMRRGEWTPSRHQYLCSEHFSEDCFDIRWGIRYLKNTAIPTLFPSTGNDCENKVSLQSPKDGLPSETKDSESVPTKIALVLRKTYPETQPDLNDNTVTKQSPTLLKVPLLPESAISCPSSLLETCTTVCQVTLDSGVSAASCLTSSISSEEQTDSIVELFGCETLGPSSTNKKHIGGISFQSQQNLESIKDKHPGSILEETRLSDGEHTLVHEHSYCRPDTDKDEQLTKILSLHAKILELGRREESTVAKIHCLENEIVLLKRDEAVFREKQKILEDYISSILL
ncbi:THAP domain-containing protein 5-like isoform X1 [Cyprinodon tularosa]|uniref:THAP domain-containing protein 5-like isoform X1 n=2 Tax=Cyprinodon tularosa TaxID=77115 RepID=UPI0018E236CB|nr:THAP domain-containing protein 5-like isoform X1 [Cyprinodon tularosa]